jgi:hypothetical protein
MRDTLRRAAGAGIVALCADATAAGELAFGLGAQTDGRGESLTATAEWRGEPVWRPVAGFAARPAAAGEIEAGGDLWAGVGAHLAYAVAERLRLEGSFMPGLYREGPDGDDLGHVVEFRSQIGVSWLAVAGVRVGIAFEHKSNAGLAERNPGINTLLATVALAY